jgi:hypothetical protein
MVTLEMGGGSEWIDPGRSGLSSQARHGSSGWNGAASLVRLGLVSLERVSLPARSGVDSLAGLYRMGLSGWVGYGQSVWYGPSARVR